MSVAFDEDQYNTLTGYLVASMFDESKKILDEHPEFLGPGRDIPKPMKPLVLTMIETRLLDPLRWVISAGAKIAGDEATAQTGYSSFGAELREAAKAGGNYFHALVDGYGPDVLDRMPLGPDDTFQTQVGLAITWGDASVLGKVLEMRPHQAQEVSWDSKLPLEQIEDLRLKNAQTQGVLSAKEHLIRVQLARLSALEAVAEMDNSQIHRPGR